MKDYLLVSKNTDLNLNKESNIKLLTPGTQILVFLEKGQIPDKIEKEYRFIVKSVTEKGLELNLAYNVEELDKKYSKNCWQQFKFLIWPSKTHSAWRTIRYVDTKESWILTNDGYIFANIIGNMNYEENKINFTKSKIYQNPNLEFLKKFLSVEEFEKNSLPSVNWYDQVESDSGIITLNSKISDLETDALNLKNSELLVLSQENRPLVQNNIILFSRQDIFANDWENVSSKVAADYKDSITSAIIAHNSLVKRLLVEQFTILKQIQEKLKKLIQKIKNSYENYLDILTEIASLEDTNFTKIFEPDEIDLFRKQQSLLQLNKYFELLESIKSADKSGKDFKILQEKSVKMSDIERELWFIFVKLKKQNSNPSWEASEKFIKEVICLKELEIEQLKKSIVVNSDIKTDFDFANKLSNLKKYPEKIKTKKFSEFEQESINIKKEQLRIANSKNINSKKFNQIFRLKKMQYFKYVFLEKISNFYQDTYWINQISKDRIEQDKTDYNVINEVKSTIVANADLKSSKQDIFFDFIDNKNNENNLFFIILFIKNNLYSDLFGKYEQLLLLSLKDETKDETSTTIKQDLINKFKELGIENSSDIDILFDDFLTKYLEENEVKEWEKLAPKSAKLENIFQNIKEKTKSIKYLIGHDQEFVKFQSEFYTDVFNNLFQENSVYYAFIKGISSGKKRISFKIVKKLDNNYYLIFAKNKFALINSETDISGLILSKKNMCSKEEMKFQEIVQQKSENIKKLINSKEETQKMTKFIREYFKVTENFQEIEKIQDILYLCDDKDRQEIFLQKNLDAIFKNFSFKCSFEQSELKKLKIPTENIETVKLKIKFNFSDKTTGLEFTEVKEIKFNYKLVPIKEKIKIFTKVKDNLETNDEKLEKLLLKINQNLESEIEESKKPILEVINDIEIKFLAATKNVYCQSKIENLRKQCFEFLDNVSNKIKEYDTKIKALNKIFEAFKKDINTEKEQINDTLTKNNQSLELLKNLSFFPNQCEEIIKQDLSSINNESKKVIENLAQNITKLNDKMIIIQEEKNEFKSEIQTLANEMKSFTFVKKTNWWTTVKNLVVKIYRYIFCKGHKSQEVVKLIDETKKNIVSLNNDIVNNLKNSSDLKKQQATSSKSSDDVLKVDPEQNNNHFFTGAPNNLADSRVIEVLVVQNLTF